ncbi:hypothetical protein V1281_004404 [Nitrobacteraceae bacterium AZCC 2161]
MAVAKKTKTARLDDYWIETLVAASKIVIGPRQWIICN